MVNKIENKSVYDALTMFFVVDISNTERKNLDRKGKVYFYDSISLISRAIICGFAAPLFYIFLLGNIAGIIYTLVYNFSLEDELNVFKFTFRILNIVPSLFVEVFLYFIYVCRNRKVYIDFKGDYILNCFMHPLLNADILAAYVESVNFYYYFNGRDTDYIKSYGEYKNKINEVCVKDYLSIAYAICMILFILFYILNYLILNIK